MSEVEKTYRELHKSKDQHGPKAPKIRIREEPTKEREEEDSPYKVCDYVCWLWQREVHVIEHICYQIVSNCCNSHHLKCLKTWITHPNINQS